MVTQTGQTQVINKALALIGNDRQLQSIDDNSAVARQFKSLWPMAVDSVLALHPWNFALKRKEISRVNAQADLVGAAAFKYELPADCLRWLPPSTQDEGYFEGEEEGGFIWSPEEGPLILRYIARIDDITRWSPLAADVLAALLAFDACEAITGSQSVKDRLGEDLQIKIKRARRADGLATGNRSRNMVRSSRWVSARYGAGVTR
jgi:hypothetical protein